MVLPHDKLFSATMTISPKLLITFTDSRLCLATACVMWSDTLLVKHFGLKLLNKFIFFNAVISCTTCLHSPHNVLHLCRKNSDYCCLPILLQALAIELHLSLHEKVVKCPLYEYNWNCWPHPVKLWHSQCQLDCYWHSQFELYGMRTLCFRQSFPLLHTQALALITVKWNQ